MVGWLIQAGDIQSSSEYKCLSSVIETALYLVGLFPLGREVVERNHLQLDLELSRGNSFS